LNWAAPALIFRRPDQGQPPAAEPIPGKRATARLIRSSPSATCTQNDPFGTRPQNQAADRQTVEIGGYPRATRRSAATVRNGNLEMSPTPTTATNVSIPVPARSWH
jgi:hypothetical protein